jgi:hypothetical protein
MSVLIGIADEYGTIWSGEPGASVRIGDLVARGDEETQEVRIEVSSSVDSPPGSKARGFRLELQGWQVERGEETLRAIADEHRAFILDHFGLKP